MLLKWITELILISFNNIKFMESPWNCKETQIIWTINFLKEEMWWRSRRIYGTSLGQNCFFHGVLLANDCLIPECSCRTRSFQLAFSVCWMRWQRAQDNLVTQWHPKGLPELSCNHSIDLSLRLSLPAIICVTWWWCWTRCRAATEITLLFFYCVFIRRQGIGAYFALIVGAVEWRSWRSNTNYI